MILIASYVLLLVLTRAVVESSVSCGGHHAPSCGDCGPQHWCNGDCSWSEPQQICKGGYGGELFHATIAVAYDQLFSEQMRGDQEAEKAIKTIIDDANRKMGPESNLRPPVKLQVKGGYHKVYENAWWKHNGQPDFDKNGFPEMPRSLTSKEKELGVPIVLITGEGGMNGLARCKSCRVPHTCSVWNQGSGSAISSCDFSTGNNLAWCSNVLVHEIGHLLGMRHDVQIGCPDKSGHMSSQHTKWSTCSNRDWQLQYGKCRFGGKRTK